MDGKMNGAAAPPAGPEIEDVPGLAPEELRAVAERAMATNPAGALKSAEAVLDAQLRQPIGMMLRGIMVSCPGIPADAVLRSIARVTAGLMGDAIMGDVVPVLNIRAGFKKAFEDGLKAAPIKTPPAPPNATMAAAFERTR